MTTGKSSRLPGIDLFRGLAVIAVAILHSDNHMPTHGWAAFLEHFASFAVPFFLATSFYLAVRKLYISQSPYSLRSRLSRLLIPYVIWTGIYLLFTLLKYTISSREGEIGAIFRDPVSIIFLGSPAYHLYFIPLLLIGTLLLKGAEWLVQQQIRVGTVLFLLILSEMAYEVILISGNGFELGANAAFQTAFSAVGINVQQYPLLRVGAIAIAWILRCLPYIALALLWQHPFVQQRLPELGVRSVVITGLIFMLINIFGDRMLLVGIYEIARGYTALIFALSLSTVIKDHPLITSLGLCSFGIYLMHLIWVETLKTVLGRIFPYLLTNVTALTLLIFACLACTISWFLTALLIRQKGFLPKALFG
ncbi:MAG: acyltransferase [Scytolyngbya sp. HA4215-MV1]|jgi:peptidoglycan/LPS O-acetylase OafA/YrhL|nr:acyltransferase [Scytolyngbya sp. HA4215-MV1]